MPRGLARSCLASLICFAASLVKGDPGRAAPPPPGWDVAYRARACGASPAETSIEMGVRHVGLRDAGIRILKSAPIAFSWAVDLDLPSNVQPIGIVDSYSAGVLLLTADGRWIVIAPPKSSTIISGSVRSISIADGARPKAATPDLGGMVTTIQQDGSTIARYDLDVCGFGARAQQSFRLSDGAHADVVAAIDPTLGGFSENAYILVAGRRDGEPGQLAFWPVDGDVTRPLGPPIVPVPPGRTLRLLSQFDIAGGCHGVAGFGAPDGSTTLSTFCKPGLADATTLLAGDVGLPVVRNPPAVREPVTLARFSISVVGASASSWLDHDRAQLLVLARSPSGSARIIALTGQGADYPIKR